MLPWQMSRTIGLITDMGFPFQERMLLIRFTANAAVQIHQARDFSLWGSFRTPLKVGQKEIRNGKRMMALAMLASLSEFNSHIVTRQKARTTHSISLGQSKLRQYRQSRNVTIAENVPTMEWRA